MRSIVRSGGLTVPIARTHAIRQLDRPGVPFKWRAYEVEPDDLAAETVARKVGPGGATGRGES